MPRLRLLPYCAVLLPLVPIVVARGWLDGRFGVGWFADWVLLATPVLIVVTAALTVSRLAVLAGAVVALGANSGPLFVRWLTGHPIDEEIILVGFWLFAAGTAVAVGLSCQRQLHTSRRWRNVGLYVGAAALLWGLIRPESWQLAPMVQGPLRSGGVSRHLFFGQPATFGTFFVNQSSDPVAVKQVTVRAGNRVVCYLSGPAVIAPGAMAEYVSPMSQCPVSAWRSVVAFASVYTVGQSATDYRTVSNTYVHWRPAD